MWQEMEEKRKLWKIDSLTHDHYNAFSWDGCAESDDGCDGCDDGEDKMMMVTVLTMHIVFGESKLLTLQLLVLSKHDPLTLSFTALSL